MSDSNTVWLIMFLLGYFIVIPFIISEKINGNINDLTFKDLYFGYDEDYTMFYNICKLLLLGGAFVWWILLKILMKIVVFLFIKKKKKNKKKKK